MDAGKFHLGNAVMGMNMGYMPIFGASGVDSYMSPQAQVIGINQANQALPAFARYNPQAIENTARQQQNNFMRDYGNPYLARVRSENSLRSGDGMNSFAQQDNAFENAEMARQASNVYFDSKNNELERINALRNSYLGVPTNNMDNVGEASWQAAIQQQELERQRSQDLWGRIGNGVGAGAPFFGSALGTFGTAYANQAQQNPNAGVLSNTWNALFGR